ncbi:unnamed protein product [Alternaria alternata]
MTEPPLESIALPTARSFGPNISSLAIPTSRSNPSKRAAKVIISIDYGFTRTKTAFAVIFRGQSNCAVRPNNVVRVRSEASNIEEQDRGYVPSLSLYTKGSSTAFGWQALDIIRKNRERKLLHIAGVKPRKAFPDSAVDSRFDLPEPHGTGKLQNTARWSKDQVRAFEELDMAGDIDFEEDVIIEYLTWTFDQIKQYPYSPWSQRLVDESTEIVLAVTCPVAWNRLTRAQYKRQIEVAATKARIGQHETAYRGQFRCLPGVVDDMEEYSHLVHVHLYTEPEAAARWILAHLRREELQELCNAVVIVNDIGGGTADLVPYLVSPSGNSFYRLEDPIGEECGSHMLNECFETLLLSKLAVQRACLEKKHGRKLESIVVEFTDDFEKKKASLFLEDIPLSKVDEPILYKVEGYMPDNVVTISRGELKAQVFQPWLERNAQLLQKGIKSIMDSGWRSVFLCLIGGGAEHPMLQTYLKHKVVDPMEKVFTAQIRFMKPQVVRESGAFVARGAILAAGNTDTITEWEAQVNFGMLQPIWQKGSRDIVAHLREDLPRERDPDSNGPAELIKVVPKWIIRQNTRYTSSFVFPQVESVHVFYESTDKWPLNETFVALVGKAQEHLTISDVANRSQSSPLPLSMMEALLKKG